MAEKMILKTGLLSPAGHAALFAKMKAEDVGMAEVLRSLLARYLAGEIVLDDSLSGVQSKFYVPPDLLAAAEAKGRTQGYSFGVLVGRLVDKALVQNNQGETNGN